MRAEIVLKVQVFTMSKKDRTQKAMVIDTGFISDCK